MKKINFSIKGFTLVELLVAIGIMALLTGIITSNLTTSRKKARDAKRISDVGQIQLALELVFDRCNSYPASIDVASPIGPIPTVSTANVCTTSGGTNININTFLSPVPTPPGVGTTQTAYSYATNGTQTDYVLMTQLETYNEILKDDFDGNSYGSITCGTVNNGESTTETKYCLTSQ